MIVEMRTYKTRPGMRSRFIEIFLSKAVPAHHEIGMKVLGPFLSVDDPDTFFFMRGFPDMASRDPMKATVLRRGALETGVGAGGDAHAGEIRGHARG